MRSAIYENSLVALLATLAIPPGPAWAAKRPGSCATALGSETHLPPGWKLTSERLGALAESLPAMAPTLLDFARAARFVSDPAMGGFFDLLGVYASPAFTRLEIELRSGRDRSDRIFSAFQWHVGDLEKFALSNGILREPLTDDIRYGLAHALFTGFRPAVAPLDVPAFLRKFADGAPSIDSFVRRSNGMQSVMVRAFARSTGYAGREPIEQLIRSYQKRLAGKRGAESRGAGTFLDRLETRLDPAISDFSAGFTDRAFDLYAETFRGDLAHLSPDESVDQVRWVERQLVKDRFGDGAPPAFLRRFLVEIVLEWRTSTGAEIRARARKRLLPMRDTILEIARQRLG